MIISTRYQLKSKGTAAGRLAMPFSLEQAVSNFDAEGN